MTPRRRRRVVVALVLTAIAAFLLWYGVPIPSSTQQALLERALESTLGRQVSIGRGFHLALLPRPSLVVRDVTIANAPWAKEPDLATVDEFRIVLARGPLLRGVMKAYSIDVSGLTIWLESDADGKPNWRLADPDDAAGGGTGRVDLSADRILLEDLTIHHLHPGERADLLVLERVSLTDGADAAAFEVAGTVQDERTRLSGSLPPIATAFDGGPIRISDLHVEFGKSKGHGTARIVPGTRPVWHVQFDRGTLDTSGWKSSSGESSNGSGSAWALQLDALANASFDAHVRLDRIELSDPGIRVTETKLSLAHGRLRLDPLQLEYGSAVLHGHAAMDPAAPTKLSASVRATDVDLEKLLPAAGLSDTIRGRVDLAIDVESRGRSPDELAGALDGRAVAAVSDGRVPTRYLDLRVDLPRLLFRRQAETTGETEIDCAAVELTAKQGVIAANYLHLDAKKLLVGVEGGIDLAKDRVDLVVIPRPRNQTDLALYSDVRIEGTLEEPRATIVKRSLVRTPAVLLAGWVAQVIPYVHPGEEQHKTCMNEMQKIVAEVSSRTPLDADTK